MPQEISLSVTDKNPPLKNVMYLHIQVLINLFPTRMKFTWIDQTFNLETCAGWSPQAFHDFCCDQGTCKSCVIKPYQAQIQEIWVIFAAVAMSFQSIFMYSEGAKWKAWISVIRYRWHRTSYGSDMLANYWINGIVPIQAKWRLQFKRCDGLNHMMICNRFVQNATWIDSLPRSGSTT